MKDYPIEIFNEGSLKFEEGKTLQIADFVRSTVNTDFDVFIGWLNIIILKTDEHTNLNARHLGHNYPTDILTFEYDEEVVMNGEIYINEEVMVENAVEFGVEVDNELIRLIVHGVLHLAGLDDHTVEEKNFMTRNEEKYLKLIGTKGFM